MTLAPLEPEVKHSPPAGDPVVPREEAFHRRSLTRQVEQMAPGKEDKPVRFQAEQAAENSLERSLCDQASTS